MKCLKCSKKVEYVGLCLDCYLRANPLNMGDFTVSECACGKIKYKLGYETDMSVVVSGLVRKNLIVPRDVKADNVRVVFERGGKRLKLTVTLDVFYNGESRDTAIEKVVKLLPISCTVCSRRSGRSYGAVIQFRGVEPDELRPDEIVDFSEGRQGADAYIASQDYARWVAGKYIRDGFIVKESVEDAGMRDGRALTRLFISIKPAVVNVHDVINFKGNYHLIASAGRKVRLVELASGRTQNIDVSRISDAETVLSANDLKTGTVTSVRPDGVQVMDAGYNMIDVSGEYDLSEGDKVFIADIQGRNYVIPAS